MIKLLGILCLVAVMPRDRVDVTEINHCSLEQVIYWDLQRDGEYRVVAWRLLKPGMIPRYDRRRKLWVAVYLDPKGGGLREVSSVAYRETWTDHDPEIFDRQFLSPHDRRGLMR